MAIVISSVGTKGGTGKTSLVRNLGIVLARNKKRVLLIDLCQNSDVATRMGYDREAFKYDTYDWVSEKVPFEKVVQHDKETGVDLIPASNLVEKIQGYVEKTRQINQEWILKEKIQEIENRYDYIFFDNHPTETNRMMIYSLVASNIALIPTVMDISSVIATIRTVDIIKALQTQGLDLNYFVVPMAVDFSKGFQKDLDKVKEDFSTLKINNFTSAIRFSAAILRAGLNNEVVKDSNKYIKNVMDDYDQVAREIIESTMVELGGRQ